MQFIFDNFKTNVYFSRKIPDFQQISAENNINTHNILLIADENTKYIAELIGKNENLPLCLIKSGEENKNWLSIETILTAANNANLNRDGVFLAVGGGVIGDLAGFAASIYKRGCRFILVSTTLLGMVDASLGGKTGFDLFGIKNLAGTFYPASTVYIHQETLSTLPKKEWKSGFAELIKTAILADFLEEIKAIREQGTKEKFDLCSFFSANYSLLFDLIEKAVVFKGSIVSEDMREAGKRKLLNLGHTFAHALESVLGLGTISHGEAVAWGMVLSCELGVALGITPNERAEKIINLINYFGYENTFPFAVKKDAFLNFIKSDKKNKNGKLTFIVPNNDSAHIIEIESGDIILEKIILKGLI